jgi:hypothetical protein
LRGVDELREMDEYVVRVIESNIHLIRHTVSGSEARVISELESKSAQAIKDLKTFSVTLQNPSHHKFLRYLLRNMEFREYMDIHSMSPMHDTLSSKLFEHTG